jgi:hypothetical protein
MGVVVGLVEHDVDTADGLDEALDALEPDEDVGVDLDVERLGDGLAHRQPAVARS